MKGGGHAYNIGHSSTTGVQISMARFTGLDYDSGSGTVTIGTGLIWDQVYSQLEPFGVMVNGGRVPGVGVSYGQLLDPLCILWLDICRRCRFEPRSGVLVEGEPVWPRH